MSGTTLRNTQKVILPQPEISGEGRVRIHGSLDDFLGQARMMDTLSHFCLANSDPMSEQLQGWQIIPANEKKFCQLW